MSDSAPPFSNLPEVVAGRATTNAPIREGLPPNYRMRADAHYVDQLIAPVSRTSAATANSPSGLPVEPNPPRLAALDADLASSLTAVLSSTAILAEGTPRLTRSVTLDMIRAEVQRATCVLRAASVLRHGVPDERQLVSPQRIVTRVADIVGADARLRGIAVHSSADLLEGAISVDEELLASTLAGVVLMLAGALHHVEDACLDIVAGTEPAGRVTIAIEQESVVVPESWMTPMSSAALDEPGGHKLVPLLALRQVADAYGGRLVASRLPHGTRIALELPLIARRARR